jgi:hypothetical protein
VVLAAYAWFASSGTFTTWESPTRYFADLARGFAQGHLYLPTQEARYDYSLFGGRYYLYFGPVPATILLFLRPLFPWRVGDLQLTFAFVTGTFVVQCVLALTIWNRLFRGLPTYLLSSSILLAGLASPTTFLLGNYVGGRVYEAAISGGQFFMMGGLLAAVNALERRTPAVWLALAGSLWALAIGTRINLIVPIGFMTLMVAGWMLAREKIALRALTKLAHLALPLALGLAALGWYNWARFGFVLETGYNYTTNTALQVGREFKDAFDPVFVVQNLWSYLLTLPDIGPVFPYVSARRASTAPIFDWYSLPDLYSAQTLTGLLFTVPFILFAFVPLIRLVQRRPDGQDKAAAFEGQNPRLLNWMVLTLSGAVLATSGVLLTYYWVAERFLADVMPTLILLSVLGFWQGFGWIPKGILWEKVYAGLGVSAAAVSIAASTLIAISVNDARLQIIERLSSQQ